jgi:hypothetical protein
MKIYKHSKLKIGFKTVSKKEYFESNGLVHRPLSILRQKKSKTLFFIHN